MFSISSCFVQQIEKQPKAKRRRAIILDSDEEENKESKDFINQQNEGEQNKKSHWVQCDNPECQKWRRIDYDADISKLANAEWICDMNEGLPFIMVLQISNLCFIKTLIKPNAIIMYIHPFSSTARFINFYPMQTYF